MAAESATQTRLYLELMASRFTLTYTLMLVMTLIVAETMVSMGPKSFSAACWRVLVRDCRSRADGR